MPTRGSASSGLTKAAEEATNRFKEAAKTANERLDKLRDGTISSLPSPAAEALASLQWVTCMVLNTAEEALKAKTAVIRAHEQHMHDHLERAQLTAEGAQETMEVAILERDAAQKEVQVLSSKMRKDSVAARQRQAKDAARLQALQEQASQLQANLRLSEAAWAEERRSDQASAAQRERNFQSVIVRLQAELDAAGAAPKARQSEVQPVEPPAATSEEMAALRGRVGELQSQCDRGVSLIERLKARLQASEKEKEALQQRERDLCAQLSGAKEQRRLTAARAEEAQEAAREQMRALRRESGPVRERYEMEMRLMGEEMDILQALVKAAEERARESAASTLAATHKLAAAEAAKAETEAVVQQLQAQQQEQEQQVRNASSGAVNLLRAALSESQRKLNATHKLYEEVATELALLKSSTTSAPKPLQATAQPSNGQSSSANPLKRPAENPVASTMPAGYGRFATPSTQPGQVRFHGATPTTSAANSPVPSAAPAPIGSAQRTIDGDEHAMRGLGRLRASLLDSLRAERTKLERERALLGR